MNKRNFLKSLVTLPFLPFIKTKADSKILEPKFNRMNINHQYSEAYHELRNDLWTPEEIVDAGFVFVSFPTFIHRVDDPRHPIMKSYCQMDSNLRPVVVKTKMYTPWYIKTYDFDLGRRRGIESINDYYNKKEVFKSMILKWMKENEFHYVYRVLLGDSPISWVEKFGNADMIYHMFPVFVRASRLPI